jgi:hypothetical protein
MPGVARRPALGEPENSGPFTAMDGVNSGPFTGMSGDAAEAFRAGPPAPVSANVAAMPRKTLRLSGVK